MSVIISCPICCNKLLLKKFLYFLLQFGSFAILCNNKQFMQPGSIRKVCFYAVFSMMIFKISDWCMTNELNKYAFIRITICIPISYWFKCSVQLSPINMKFKCGVLEWFIQSKTYYRIRLMQEFEMLIIVLIFRVVFSDLGKMVDVRRYIR